MRYFHLHYRLSAAELPEEQELSVAVVHCLHTGQPEVFLHPECTVPELPAAVVLHMLAAEPESEPPEALEPPAVQVSVHYMLPEVPEEQVQPVVVVHMLAVEPELEHRMLPVELPVVQEPPEESEHHMLAVLEQYMLELHLPVDSMSILLLQADCLRC
jgi:hypothetical protein